MSLVLPGSVSSDGVGPVGVGSLGPVGVGPVGVGPVRVCFVSVGSIYCEDVELLAVARTEFLNVVVLTVFIFNQELYWTLPVTSSELFP